jgi:hypothetical protein
LHASYHQNAYQFSGDSELRYMTKPAGGSWSPPMILDVGEQVGVYTSVAVANGGVHIAYADGDDTRLKYVGKEPGLPFGSPLSAGDKSFDCEWLSAGVDPSGGVHIAHRGTTGLRYVHKPAGGQLSPAVEPVENWGGGHGTSLVVDASGTVHVTHADYAFVYYLVKPPGQSWQAPVSIAPIIGYSFGTSLVVGDGQAVDVCFTSGDGYVQHVSRSVEGAWSDPTKVDAIGELRFECDLVVDAQKGVHIVYYESTSADLKYAYRAACQ